MRLLLEISAPFILEATKELAEENYRDYVELSYSDCGEAAGEPVIFFVDGEIEKEIEPAFEED